MAKHKFVRRYRAELFQEWLRLRNRWLFFTKPSLKRKIRNLRNLIGL